MIKITGTNTYIEVDIDGRVTRIAGEMTVNGFTCLENSIDYWISPEIKEITEEEKEMIINKVIEKTTGSNMEITFDKIGKKGFECNFEKIKAKKIKGNFKCFISQDEKEIVTASRNTVYIHNLENKECIFQAKSLSNIYMAVISPDKQIIAVKNTLGEIELLDAKTGTSLYKNKMCKKQGENLCFTDDSQYIVDIDWNGNVMRLDCKTGEFTILDNHIELCRCYYIHYDVHTDQIYRFIAAGYGNAPGFIECSTIESKEIAKGIISFKKVQTFKDKLPMVHMGISFCKNHNYYYELTQKKLIQTDKNFKILNTFDLPNTKAIKSLDHFWISPEEKYLYLDFGIQCSEEIPKQSDYETCPWYSVLIDLQTMQIIHEYNLPYVSDFTMYENDTKYVISTWNAINLYSFDA